MDVTNILESVSLIFAAWTVIIGVNAWQREYIGKRKLELAEEVLALFYEARDAVRYIRNPFGYAGEGSARNAAPNESPEEKQINDRANVVFERYNKRQALFNKLYSMRYRYMARFSKDSAKPFDELNKIVNDIFTSAHMLSYYWKEQGHRQWKNDAEFRQHLEEMHKYEAIFWEKGSKEDSIIPRVDKVISDIEAQSLRIIGGNKVMKIRWWHWFEFYSRFIVWIFGLLLASITVITSINSLPEKTAIMLIVFLIIFLIAALITWYFDVSRLFPPRRRSGG